MSINYGSQIVFNIYFISDFLYILFNSFVRLYVCVIIYIYSIYFFTSFVYFRFIVYIYSIIFITSIPSKVIVVGSNIPTPESQCGTIARVLFFEQKAFSRLIVISYHKRIRSLQLTNV